MTPQLCTRCLSGRRRVGIAPVRLIETLVTLTLPLVNYVDRLFPWLCRIRGPSHHANLASPRAMEEAKLIRMAAAISEYTVSSMLRETVHSATTQSTNGPVSEKPAMDPRTPAD